MRTVKEARSVSRLQHPRPKVLRIMTYHDTSGQGSKVSGIPVLSLNCFGIITSAATAPTSIGQPSPTGPTPLFDWLSGPSPTRGSPRQVSHLNAPTRLPTGLKRIRIANCISHNSKLSHPCLRRPHYRQPSSNAPSRMQEMAW